MPNTPPPSPDAVTVPRLDIRNVSKHYGRHPAVQNVSLRVAPGETVAFLGPNGAGKTTTLKMIAGLLLADEGDILVDGRSVFSDPLAARQNMGYIPDRPFVYERLTGREFLAFIADLYELDPGAALTEAERWLGKLGLGAFLDERIEQYSHGMKQRLVMAAALFRKPSLLCIDEPMVGLDPHGAKLVKDLFREAAATGAGLLLSTHSLSVAEQVCDRAVILHRGRILAEGTVDDLRGRAGLATGALEDVFLALTDVDDAPVGAR